MTINLSNDPELKKELARRLLAAMDQGGIERRQMFPVFGEDDYVAGALTVMNALGLWDYVGGRGLLILSGTALALGDHQKRPTDQDKLKYHEAECKRIREGNGWEPYGTEMRRATYPRLSGGFGQAFDLVAWYDGYGGVIVGKVKEDETDVSEASNVCHYYDPETAEDKADEIFKSEGLE